MEFEYEFEAVLEADAATGELLVVVPAAVAAAYGAREEVPVQTAIEGFPYAGALTPLGDGYLGLVVPRPVRRAVGKTVGDALRVALRRDTAERVLPPPDDLAAALAAAPAAQATYQRLPPPEQRQYLRWLAGAKTPERRSERLRETISRLERGLKRG